ncbi:hypothetical protein ACJX0J_023559, partial [Zea mays]
MTGTDLAIIGKPQETATLPIVNIYPLRSTFQVSHYTGLYRKSKKIEELIYSHVDNISLGIFLFSHNYP